MGFIRVRQAKGPRAEFDISEAAYARKKDAYVVVDKRPARTSRAVDDVAVLPAVEAVNSAKGEE